MRRPLSGRCRCLGAVLPTREPVTLVPTVNRNNIRCHDCRACWGVTWVAHRHVAWRPGRVLWAVLGRLIGAALAVPVLGLLCRLRGRSASRSGWPCRMRQRSTSSSGAVPVKAALCLLFGVALDIPVEAFFFLCPGQGRAWPVIGATTSVPVWRS